jgi:hypothetical protein
VPIFRIIIIYGDDSKVKVKRGSDIHCEVREDNSWFNTASGMTEASMVSVEKVRDDRHLVVWTRRGEEF